METLTQQDMPAWWPAASRQVRRQWMRQKAKADARQAPRRMRPRKPRRIDLLAPYFPIAQAMLMSSDKATDPKFRAVVKMAKYLLVSELHRFTMRHQRGGWRSWPRSIGREMLDAMWEKNNGR